MDLPDSHCHIEVGGTNSSTLPEEHTSETETLTVVCATSESDWPHVSELLTLQAGRNRRRFVGAFGVHPWWAGTATEETFAALEVALLEHPQSLVGEIGIDTIRFAASARPVAADSEAAPEGACCCGRNNNNNSIGGITKAASLAPEESAALLERQLTVFERQMSIAAKHRRPVSLHVVGKGSYGLVTDYFTRIARHNKQALALLSGDAAGDVGNESQQSSPTSFVPLPPAVIFHGFTGSLDFVKNLLTTFTLSNRTAKMAEVVNKERGCAFPLPEFYVGLGVRTTLKTKSFASLFGDIFTSEFLARTAHQPTSFPRQNQKDIGQRRKIPPEMVLLETDCFYQYSKNCNGSGDGFRFSMTPTDAGEQLTGLSTIATTLVGESTDEGHSNNSRQLAVKAAMGCCGQNLRAALRSVL